MSNKKTIAESARAKKAQAKNAQRIDAQTERINVQVSRDTATNTLAREFMTEYIKNPSSEKVGTLLMQLSTVIVHNRLDKMIADVTEKDSTYNLMLQFKRDVTLNAKWSTMVDQLNGLYTVTFNADGDRIVVCSDKERAQRIERELQKFSALTGNDLVSEVQLSIWEYVNAQKQLSANTLLDVTHKVRPSSMTYKNGDVKDRALWQYDATNGIKNAGGRVSAYVNAQRGLCEQMDVYDQIVTRAKDDTEKEIEIVRYVKSDSMTVNEICDYNGKVFSTVQDQTAHNELWSKIKNLNLTAREMYILKEHYIDHWYTAKTVDDNGNIVKTRKYGVKPFTQIADELKVSLSMIERADRAMRSVFANSDSFSEYASEQTVNKMQSCKAVTVVKLTDNTTFICASLGDASAKTGVDVSRISKVIKGQRKSANGYTFKLA